MAVITTVGKAYTRVTDSVVITDAELSWGVRGMESERVLEQPCGVSLSPQKGKDYETVDRDTCCRRRCGCEVARAGTVRDIRERGAPASSLTLS